MKKNKNIIYYLYLNIPHNRVELVPVYDSKARYGKLYNNVGADRYEEIKEEFKGQILKEFLV